MRNRRRANTLLPFLPILLATPLAAAGQVHVVAPAAGPGVDFTNLQTALTTAGNGDVILLKSGTYSTGSVTPFNFAGKGLTIVEDAGQTATIASALSISNISAGQQVCLRNVDVAAVDAGTAVSLNNNTGAIWIEGALLSSTSNFFPMTPAGEGVRATNCANLVLARCTLIGATISTSLGAGYAGLAATTSNVALYDCTCRGGHASDGSALLVGGDGAAITGGFLFASGTSFQGGNGGDGSAGFPLCQSGAPGGHGLHLKTGAPAASTLECAFTGGLGGAPPPGTTTCSGGAAGSGIKIDSGTHGPLAGTAHSLVCAPTCRETKSFTLTYTGEPGELAFIDFSGLQGFTYFPDFRGVLVLGFPLFTQFHGTLPASGTLVKSSGAINDLGVATEGVTIYLQSAFVSAANGLFQAGPSATVLLDASL